MQFYLNQFDSLKIGLSHEGKCTLALQVSKQYLKKDKQKTVEKENTLTNP